MKGDDFKVTSGICKEDMAAWFGNRVKATRIGNNYNQTVWVKCDVEKKYVLMSGGGVSVNLDVAGAGVGVGLQRASEVQWKTVQSKFSPIKSGGRQKFEIDSKGCKLVYITIVAADGYILCNALPRQLKTNVVVTEDGQVVTAEKKNPMSAALESMVN